MIGYQYVTLRCVPRVERDEFVNVAVVLYCQNAAFLECAYALDAARLRALAPDVDLDGLRRTLERIRAVCAGHEDEAAGAARGLGQRFGWIIAPRSTVVQPGPVHGGLCDDPAVELIRLMDRQVHPTGPRAPLGDAVPVDDPAVGGDGPQ